MSVHFRAVCEADYAAICNLVPSAAELYLVYPRGTYPFSIEQVTSLAESRKELTVALADAKVVGFANLYDFKTNECAFIGNVVIDTSCRGKGLGKKLVGHMLHLIFTTYDLPEAHISVFSDNIPALLLYSGLGFRPYQIEERADYAARRVALVHMKLGRDQCKP